MGKYHNHICDLWGNSLQEVGGIAIADVLEKYNSALNSTSGIQKQYKKI